MWVIMIISYAFISIIEIKSFAKVDGKGKHPLYITLMVISCAIGISSAYVNNMPSPANPIKDFIISIIGS